MNIVIREMDNNTIRFVKKAGSSFEVSSKLVLHAEDDKIGYTVVTVPPYTKQYGDEEFDSRSYLDNLDRAVFFAYVDEELVGQIRVLKNWNAYAYIDGIAVDTKYRRQGIGRALIERVVEWAKERGFPGIMLETQSNNIAGCMLYEGCGFKLCGFDTQLYKALNPSTDEIALYWYLIF